MQFKVDLYLLNHKQKQQNEQTLLSTGTANSFLKL